MGCIPPPPPPPPPPRCVRLASLLCALLGTSGLAQAACTGTVLENIGNACVWLRADDGVSTGGSWPDQSGAGNVAEVTARGDYPRVTPNGMNFHAVVDYRASAGHVLPASADVTNQYTFFGLARMTGARNGRVFSAQTNNRFFGYHGNGQDRWYDEPSPGSGHHWQWGWKYPLEWADGKYLDDIRRRREVITPAQTKPMLYTLKRAASIATFKSNVRTMLLNTPIDAKDDVYRVSLATGGVYPDESSDVSIPEFISFARPLPDAQSNRIESYLALKYGFTLGTAAEPRDYVNSENQAVWTANSGYQHRVFGLGRDGSQGLDQRVSKSTDHTLDDTSSSILTIATTPNFTSANNDSNRPKLHDSQYLVLGDNDSALNTFSADALGQRGNRIPRVWRVQNTRDRGWWRVNAVFLGFDPALLPASLANAGDLYLLVSSDANFSAATTARYPLKSVTLGGQDFLTPVVEKGSNTPGAVNMLPGVSYISLGQSSAQVCTGSAMGIANACAWYRADQGLGAGSSWADQSGAGNTAIANGSPSLTPNSVNFNATVDYRGGAGHTLPATADVTNHYTFLGLARMTGTHNGRAFSDRFNNRLFGYWGLESNARQDLWVDSEGYYGDYLGNNGYKSYDPATASQTRPMLYTLRRDANSASSFKSNGRTLSTIGMNTTGKYRVALANGGLYDGGSDSADVSIPEFFSFKRALSDAEIDRIESYLALKYGVTLGSAADPKNYVNSANQAVWTANRVYQHRVFGLGRDGGSQGLDQRVSKSTNHTLDDASSSILTLATSAEFTSPDFTSANGGSRPELQPGQYLVLGDNNGDVATLGAATAEQFGRRIGRVWRAQNTGGVGAVHLGFDPTLLETNFPQDKRGFLLVSTDADFSVANTTRYALGRVTVGSKTVFTPVTDIGENTPKAVTIPNGSYITLGQESVCTGTALGIADACLWLKANDGGLTPGGTVSTWQDRSESQKNLTGVGNPSVVAGSNTTGMNFNPVVRFNGVDQSMWRNESTIGTDVSEVNIFFAMRETVRQGPVAKTLLSHFTFPPPASRPGFQWSIHWPRGYDDKLAWDRGLWDEPRHRNLSSAPFAVGVSNLGLVTNSVSSDTATIVVNAKTLTDEMPPSPGIRRTTTDLSNTRIGTSRLGSAEAHLHGDIPELLEFKRDLTPTERTRVQSYLALKYGLTLDRTGLEGNAYTSGNGTSVYSDSNYWNSIIGLGRDSVTKLDQRVSRSTQKIGPERDADGLPTFQLVKGDSPLTIATSADFTSANGNHRPAENLPLGQYLVLGDNDGALNTLSASAMGRNHNRLPRVWRAQNTRGVGPVFLGLEAAKVNFTDTGRYRLFVESGAGADGSFPVGRTSTYVLSNALSGLTGYWVPVADGAALAVNIPDGAYLSYGTLAEPQLSLSVQSRGGTGTFGFSGTNGFVASSAATEVEMQPALADPATQTLSAPDVDIVITVAMPAAGWSLETASCIDRQAATSGNPRGAVLGRVSAGDQFTIPAAQAKASADLHCTFVVRYDLGSTLNTISGRVFIDNGTGGSDVANDGHINGAEAGRSGVALRLTDCGATTHAFASSSGDGSYSLQVPRAARNGTMCVEQTLTDDYRVTQGGLDASGADATGVTLDATAAQRNRWRFAYAGASVQNLHIGNVPSSRLLVDGTRVGIAGSTVEFPHRLLAGTAGTLTFTFTLSDASPAASGWSEVLYRDLNCNAQLDASDTFLGGGLMVVADASVCVIVRQFVPAGLHEGATRQFQLQAALKWANVDVDEALTNRDHTTVGDQPLRLYKEVRNVTTRGEWTTYNSAKPGETLEYRITFTNSALEPISDLVIHSATPQHTTLVSAECPDAMPTGMACEPLSSTASPPTRPADGGTGPLRWHFTGPLSGGASGAVKYQVKVNE